MGTRLLDQAELATQLAVLRHLLLDQSIQLSAGDTQRQHVAIAQVLLELWRGLQRGEGFTPPVHGLGADIGADKVAADQRPLNVVTLLAGGGYLGQFARQRHVLKVGDVIENSETLRTLAGARVELQMADGQVLSIAPEQSVRVDDSLMQTDATPTA